MEKGIIVIALIAAAVMGMSAGTSVAEETKPSALAGVEEIKNALGLSIYLQGFKSIAPITRVIKDSLIK